MPGWSKGLIAIATATLVACGGGGGGGDNGGGVMLGDEARRAVLADLGTSVILPALRVFATEAAELETAMVAHAADPADAAALQAAQAAWAEAIVQFQRVEVVAVGPAAPSDAPGGQDLRDLIYAYPAFNACAVDRSAYAGDPVTASTRIDAMGLGAIEYLLYFDGPNSACPPDSGVDVAQSRADYAAAVAAFIAARAEELRDAWEAGEGNFIAQWSQAGAGSDVYMTPQDALDALSTSLFYVEKETKDRKIACPTGIGATGLVCSGNDVSRVEHPYARASTPSLRANVQMFRDVFTGQTGGMGMNDLLAGIDRQDIVDKLLARLDVTLDQIDTQIDPDFETEVEAIDDSAACTNASANATGEPAACALHGAIQDAMDTFRTEVVSALSLATPDRAAGDND